MQLPKVSTRHAELFRCVGAALTTAVAAWVTAMRPSLQDRALLCLMFMLWGVLAVQLRSVITARRGCSGDATLTALSQELAGRFGTTEMAVYVEQGHHGLATLEGHSSKRRITVDEVIATDGELAFSCLGHEYAHLRLGHHRNWWRTVLLSFSPVAVGLLPLAAYLVVMFAFVLSFAAETLNLWFSRRDEYAADLAAFTVLGPPYLPGITRLLGDDGDHNLWSTHPPDRERRRRLRVAARSHRAGGGPS